MEIGGEPIVWHVVRIYAAHGLRRFLLCTGYKGELIEQFVRSRGWPAGVEVRCVDRPRHAHRRSDQACGRPDRRAPFCATYADGVADIDIGRLIQFHEDHGDLATMTVVRPELQFGIAELDGDGRARLPREAAGGALGQRRLLLLRARGAGLHRGGFGPGARALRAPREPAANAFRHEGFWECMDTYKDAVLLNDIWAAGEAPWKTWG